MIWNHPNAPEPAAQDDAGFDSPAPSPRPRPCAGPPQNRTEFYARYILISNGIFSVNSVRNPGGDAGTGARTGRGLGVGAEGVRSIDDIDDTDDIDDPRTEGRRRGVHTLSRTPEGARKVEGRGCALRRGVVDVVDVVGSSKGRRRGWLPQRCGRSTSRPNRQNRPSRASVVCAARSGFGFRDSSGGKSDFRRQARRKPRAENRRECQMPKSVTGRPSGRFRERPPRPAAVRGAAAQGQRQGRARKRKPVTKCGHTRDRGA